MRPPRGRGGPMGGGRGRGRSFSGGGRSFGGGGRGFSGRGRGGYDEGPPAQVCEVGLFVHDCEGEMVCKLTNTMIPYFNAGIYLENKTRVGKVDEIFGPVHAALFTVKPDTGVASASFRVDDKLYIGTDKLLPLSRFTQEAQRGGGRGGRGGGRGAFRGGRGPPRGGFGGRGPPRGRGGGRGFGDRGRGPPRGRSFSRGRY